MALVGFLWAEIGLRLFVKVPHMLVGLACCAAGSACLALRYRPRPCPLLRPLPPPTHPRSLHTPSRPLARLGTIHMRLLALPCSKRYDGLVRLIEATPEQSLKVGSPVPFADAPDVRHRTLSPALRFL